MNKFNTVVTIVCFILSIYSCKDKGRFQKEFKTIKKDGVIVKGYVINDTIFDDTVNYYNSDNVRIRKEYYVNGKLNGSYEEYYNNGNIRIQSNFSNGFKNGINKYFDSLGRCIYLDYYYFDLPIGPVIYYDNYGINRFFFTSFDNETLLDMDYKSWVGINDFVMNLITYSYEIGRTDSLKSASLFLYLMKPPHFLTKYALYKRSKKTNEQIFVMELNAEQPFLRYDLPVPPKEYYYSIQLDIYDSILNKRSIINREVY